jgi:pimeloyl-ACP methyl ester carboxylesterase
MLKYIIAPILLLCVIAASALLAYREYLQRRVLKDTGIASPPGVDSLEEVVLGGIRQWILVRGTDASNPVLLFLHGGPGSADISLARHYDRELVKHFVVVHWDQRGAGKSYSAEIPESAITREHYVSDIRELAGMLIGRFNARKIYLVGHSWGSEIGIIAASRHPGLFHAYVGVGQVVAKKEQEEIGYRYVMDRARETGNAKAVEELGAIGPPPYPSDRELGIQRAWLRRFGGVSYGNRVRFIDSLKIGLSSPDYTLHDALRFFRGQAFSERLMWKERLRTNLFREVPRIDVPAWFFAGRSDFNTPSSLAERYYRGLIAPRGKHFIWFERAGHMIPYEDPEAFYRELVRIGKRI